MWRAKRRSPGSAAASRLDHDVSIETLSDAKLTEKSEHERTERFSRIHQRTSEIPIAKLQQEFLAWGDR